MAPELCKLCGALRDLVPFVQFKKRDKHPWKSVNFSTVATLKPETLLKLTLFQGCFSCFLNCTNRKNSRNEPHLKTQTGLTHSLKFCPNFLCLND